jgi:cystathionine beta-lyase
MRYNFDQLLPRRNTESFKWRTYPEDVLPLWVADMDFPSPEPVVRALREVVEHGVFGYPRGLHYGDCTELPEYAELVVARMSDRYGWSIAPQDIVFVPGVVVGLDVTCNMLRGSGGSVVVQPPIYPPFLDAHESGGLRRVDAELRRGANDAYEVDWAAFEAALRDEARLFLLCNPQNPVGRVFRRDELERLAEMCLSRDVLIGSDEVHSDLLYRGQRHIPIASLDPAIAQRTVTLIAPSKTFNLPGLQASAAIIPNAELRQRFQAARQRLVPWVNLPGLIALQAAYRDGQDWLDQVLVYLEANRDYLHDFVSAELPGVKMAKPEGTYLAWLDCRDTGLENPYEFFLNTARVAVGDGASFGAGGKGFVRLNFASPRAMLAEALGRMKRALETR